MPVLGFLEHKLIAMLQLLLHILRRFWSCQNCEGRSQLCLKLFWLWLFLCNIWSICSVTVFYQCTIYIIHEENILLSFQDFCGPVFLFLVKQVVCDWSWRFQRVVHERIDLDWFFIFTSYSEGLWIDSRVYPKVVIGDLDWHCTILQ